MAKQQIKFPRDGHRLGQLEFFLAFLN